MAIQLPASPARFLVRTIVGDALKAVGAAAALRRAVVRQGHVLRIGTRRYDLTKYERVVVVGAGKATAAMARAIERVLGPRLHGGLVIVKYGHALPTSRIEVAEAAHPLPDKAGLRAAKRLAALARSLTARDLLIVLLSGGASSLMPAPVRGISLKDKLDVTRLLLRCGATIREINTVRKHLSFLKGGRLAESTEATVITLILSDVLGDDISAIASGPTVADPTTFQNAMACLHRFGIVRAVPTPVRRHLLKGCRGLVPETPKPGARRFRQGQAAIIGNIETAVLAATRAARTFGLRTVVQSFGVTGEAAKAGKQFGRLARRIVEQGDPVRRPCCIVAGGETTVTVTGRGTGGRAQEFALAAAKSIAGLKNVWIAAVGTDGTDGPTDAAGALVSGETLSRAERLGLNLDRALLNHDSYPILKRLRCHIKTGPTGTNVNDLYLLLVL